MLVQNDCVWVNALNDWKNKFLRINEIRIDNFTKHPHLYKQPSSRSVKPLKNKMEKLHRKYVFAPADKAANNVIIIWKRHYVKGVNLKKIIIAKERNGHQNIHLSRWTVSFKCYLLLK